MAPMAELAVRGLAGPSASPGLPAQLRRVGLRAGPVCFAQRPLASTPPTTPNPATLCPAPHRGLRIRLSHANHLRPSRKVGPSTAAASAQAQSSPPSPPRGDGDWATQNSGLLRALPLAAGAAGGSVVLLNRILADIPAVADAGSSQARADVLGLFLAASLLLTGLQWLSLTPRVIPPVPPEGTPCLRLLPSLPADAQQELQWLWETLSSCTCCRSLVVVYRGECVLQAGHCRDQAADGQAREAVGVVVPALWGCALISTTRASGRANYLANLALFPARFDLLEFLPFNTQTAILLPLGEDDGLMVLGGDTVRGFTPLDQAWIASFGEKIDATLSQALVKSSV